MFRIILGVPSHHYPSPSWHDTDYTQVPGSHNLDFENEKLKKEFYDSLMIFSNCKMDIGHNYKPYQDQEPEDWVPWEGGKVRWLKVLFRIYNNAIHCLNFRLWGEGDWWDLIEELQ